MSSPREWPPLCITRATHIRNMVPNPRIKLGFRLCPACAMVNWYALVRGRGWCLRHSVVNIVGYTEVGTARTAYQTRPNSFPVEVSDRKRITGRTHIANGSREIQCGKLSERFEHSNMTVLVDSVVGGQQSRVRVASIQEGSSRERSVCHASLSNATQLVR